MIPINVFTLYFEETEALLRLHLEHHSGRAVRQLVLPVAGAPPRVGADVMACPDADWRRAISHFRGWTVVLRVSDFLEPGWHEAVERAAMDGCDWISGWRIDRVAPGGALLPFDESFRDTFVLEAHLLESFGQQNWTPFAARSGMWWSTGLAGKECGDKWFVPHYSIHADCRRTIAALASHASATGESPWGWRRLLHALDGAWDLEGRLRLREDLEGGSPDDSFLLAISEFLPHGPIVYVGAGGGRGVLRIRDTLAAFGRLPDIVAVEASAELGERLEAACAYNVAIVDGPDEVENHTAALVFIEATDQPRQMAARIQVWRDKVMQWGIIAGNAYGSAWTNVVTGTVRRLLPDAWCMEPETWVCGCLPTIRMTMPDTDLYADLKFNPSICRNPRTGELVYAFRTSGWNWENGMLWIASEGDAASLLDLGEDGWCYEDPRLQVLQDRLALVFTRGRYEDGGTRSEVGMAWLQKKIHGSTTVWAARETVIWPSPFGQRQEKNWTVFEWQRELHTLHTMDPWRILRLRDMAVVVTAPKLEWGYGIPRGGSPFIEAPNGRLWAFFHSSCHWETQDRKRYFVGLVEVDAETMLPVRQTAAPLLLERGDPGWTGYHVIWVAGAVIDGEEVLVSYGRNDDSCNLRRYPVSKLESMLVPVFHV
jgi:hypothetical protein